MMVAYGLLRTGLLAALFVYGTAFVINNKPSINDGVIDNGKQNEDIPEINLKNGHDLFQGDIKLADSARNALRNETFRWTSPIPYILGDDLDLNAKAVILQSFEMFRVRSCIDFKPYDGEASFIHFKKLGGCWSYVGRRSSGQELSIGERCDTKSIVEHEILHALGFYHEQSRSDRDDYVEIWWDEITEGMAHNFNTYDDSFITDLNTPYDYESVMHYGPYSFNMNANVPTITAKIPAFNNVIGQRLDLSALDLERMNRMYGCTTSLTLLDQCSFEYINICGMVQGTTDDDDWVHQLSTPATSEDYTLVGRCQDAGYFMNFRTHSGHIGRTALLESRILYPKKTEQCLQFFYKTNGSPQDRLTIWIRIDDGTGTVRRMRKIHTINADSDQSWKIAHVTLNADKKFRYVFQGIQGSDSTTTGGILIDDISLMETPCPNAVWHIRNFRQILATTVKGDSIVSPRFYSPEGYGYGLGLYPHGQATSTSDNFTGISFHLASGEDDAVMEWPVLNRQVMITLLDQDPDMTLRMSSSRSFTTDPSHIITVGSNNISRWERPTITGTLDPSCDCYRSPDYGWTTFISHFYLNRRSFLKNDDLIIFVEFSDITHLINTEVPVRAAPEPVADIEEVVPERRKRSLQHGDIKNYDAALAPLDATCDPNPCQNGGACVSENGRASCRCSSSQAFYYSGHQCEAIQMHAHIIGMLIGGVAGVIVLTVAVLAVISKAEEPSKRFI
uniref:Meprin A subunit n=1 Tax=Leptobrachium leishanense TaxID=445787 RepID=A0A8C5MAB5_9ANUR